MFGFSKTSAGINIDDFLHAYTYIHSYSPTTLGSRAMRLEYGGGYTIDAATPKSIETDVPLLPSILKLPVIRFLSKTFVIL